MEEIYSGRAQKTNPSNPVAPDGMVRPIDLSFNKDCLRFVHMKTSMPELCHLNIVNCLMGRVPLRVCSGFVHMKTQHARALPRSVPAILNCLIGRVFWVCWGFAHMKTQHARVLTANVLFSSLFPVGWCLLMLPEAFSTDICVWERMAGFYGAVLGAWPTSCRGASGCWKDRGDIL